MRFAIRGVILGTVGLALVGLAGCSEDNQKNAGDDFKNTQTAPPDILTKEPTKADMAKRYSGGRFGYPGASKAASSPAKAASSPAKAASSPATEKKE